MKRSEFFNPTLKETPKEAHIASHQLMLRAGMIQQVTSGIYSWLPLGLRVLNHIEGIIDDEQSKLGQRIIMPTIQPASLWEESGRLAQFGPEMLRMEDRHKRPMLYGPTHEEVITDLVRQHAKSYKQLPVYLYQIHWKFRDEIRPRFGVMRGREFLMKDGYSFDITQEAAHLVYEKMFDSYVKIFDRIFKDIPGAHVVPVKADPGVIGGDLSHEFQVISDVGESQIFYDPAFKTVSQRNFQTLKNMYAAADEMHNPLKYPNVESQRGIELGHVFYLGQKYTKAMNYTVVGPRGEAVYPEMGCYGIGVSRLVAAVIEASHDDRGIIWPISVAPFKVGVIDLTENQSGKGIYEELIKQGIEVLYDDRKDVRPGVKFADMDLIGVPYQIVVGKSFIEEELMEFKVRHSNEKQSLSPIQVLNFLNKILQI